MKTNAYPLCRGEKPRADPDESLLLWVQFVLLGPGMSLGLLLWQWRHHVPDSPRLLPMTVPVIAVSMIWVGFLSVNHHADDGTILRRSQLLGMILAFLAPVIVMLEVFLVTRA